MATMVKTMKEKGVVPGLLKNLLAAIHIDNLEQYQSYAVNPKEALKHSMVIGVQQPKPKGSNIPIEAETNSSILNLEPRTKRPSLRYVPTHSNVPQYTKPQAIVEETRRCKKEYFTYNSENENKIVTDF